LLKKINKNVLQLFNWIEIPSGNYNCKKEYEIVYHGRITFDKGYRVFEKLAHNNPSWRILLIGWVPPIIKEALPANIEHLSAILDKSKLYGKLAEGRVYLFPSLREGIAFSLLEAMALGLPVVASNICSNRFLFEHNKHCLIKPDHYEGYQKAVNALLSNQMLMDQTGKVNQEFTRINLSKKKYFASLYKFYSDLPSNWEC
jgi:glycosyltransferase involved in cell wall biosynthesis